VEYPAFDSVVAIKDKTKEPKLNKQSEEDLIAEIQRLRMENEYLKKLNALVQAKEEAAKNVK
jgi:transposase